MAFDYKKEYKEFYLPAAKPQIVDVPEMNFIAVRGEGDPNEEGGMYKEAIGLLYAIAFTIKMSKREVTISKDILTMSCLLLKASGGRMESAESIMPQKRISGGYPSYVCPTL